MAINFFCHCYGTRTRSKTRKLSASKEIFMVLQEVGACALPKIPSFTCLMILLSQEKLQKGAN